MQARLHNLLFVGVSRAIKWVFMSGTNGRLIQPVVALAQTDTQAFLETQLAGGAVGLFGPRTTENAVPPEPDDFGLD